jgi:hypothetical protein
MKKIFNWRSPQEGKLKGGIDVSSYGPPPYDVFSPFSFDKGNAIPVPGDEKTRACSVEGIWQGLKQINGETDFSLFTRKPRKRRGKPEGHMFRGELISYAEARRNIYVPAYIYHVYFNALPFIEDDLRGKMVEGPVYFYDTEKNPDIDDLSVPLSHASILVRILNVLVDAPVILFYKSRFYCVGDGIKAAVDYGNSLSGIERELFDETMTFAYLFLQSGRVRVDESFAGLALKYMAKQGIINAGRLANYTPTAFNSWLYHKLIKDFSI